MIVGILGGGQLGRMLALAGHPLGLQFRFFDSSTALPVKSIAETFIGPYEDFNLLKKFAKGLDLVTYEFENVPVEAVRYLETLLPVFPSSQALEISQDRLHEKTLFQHLKIPTPKFKAIHSREELIQAVRELGYPCLLKTRRLGYDGKGQFLIKTKKDTQKAWERLGKTPLILEQFIKFKRELSILAVRSKKGLCTFYPLVENHHREGILHHSLAPAPKVSRKLQSLAQTYAKRILKKLNYTGVLAIEFFQCGDQLIANEMAPRVHNSGHWTLEGAETSQFENHLRALLGLPLGSTRVVGHSVMYNLIGRLPPLGKILKIPGTHLHLYGKTPKEGRKLGHVTCLSSNSKKLREAVK